MLKNQRICVILPAYNAERTLEQTYRQIPFDLVDDVLLVDDHSDDQTVDLAHRLGIEHIIVHKENLGYGGNQKTCFAKAISLGADIIVMLHPDYQYTPLLIESMVHLIANGLYPVVLGSRVLGMGALKGGMPRYKYFANRCLTLFQNILLHQKLAEYHSGYRAFSRKVLEEVRYEANSNDYLFDNQILAQIFYTGHEIAEITCPTHYFEEASSINFRRSLRYGWGVVLTSLSYRLQKWGWMHFDIFEKKN